MSTDLGKALADKIRSVSEEARARDIPITEVMRERKALREAQDEKVERLIQRILAGAAIGGCLTVVGVVILVLWIIVHFIRKAW